MWRKPKVNSNRLTTAKPATPERTFPLMPMVPDQRLPNSAPMPPITAASKQKKRNR